jgi:hypothetical protein
MLDGSFPEYQEDLKVLKYHTKTKDNFKLANRQAIKKFLNIELDSVSHNPIEHLSI